jgi:bacterial/archaeal transporter family protein
MKFTLSWQALALLSALCAALSAIFAKLGVAGINADLATFIRTAIILAVFALLLSLTQQWQPLTQLSGRTWLFLALSALAAGGSWLFYFRALQLGDASRVAPIDKFSLVFVAVLGTVVLGERLSLANWLGMALMTAGLLLVALKG